MIAEQSVVREQGVFMAQGVVRDQGGIMEQSRISVECDQAAGANRSQGQGVVRELSRV